MSNFYPFNLNMRAGPSDAAPITIPDTGCPLEAHPAWQMVVGTGDSVLCWEDKNGTSVSVHGSNTTIKNLVFNNQFYTDGTIGCTIEYVPPGDKNWLLPLAARMINGNNLLGARWNDGKFEVVQRRNGTWSTLKSGGTPVVGDEAIFTVSGKYWKLIVNSLVVLEGTHSLADSPGYWGVSQHRSDDLDGNTILSNFNAVSNALSKTPCMTDNIHPYGTMEASSNSIDAWMGMNCNPDDAWVSDDGVSMPQQITWLGPSNQPAMVPDRLVYASLTTGGETDHGPESMTLIGTTDGVTWTDIISWTGLDFGSVAGWDTAIPGDTPYRGIGIRIDNIRAAGTYCQVGDFRVHGHVKELARTAGVIFHGEYIERTNDAVYIKDLSATGDSDDKAQLFSGTALDFDGVDDFISTDCALTDGDSYTLVASCLKSPTALNIAIANFYGANAIGFVGANFDFFPRIDEDNLYRNSVSGAVDGEIYRILMVVDNISKTIKGYVDGVLVSDISYVGNTTELDELFHIGNGGDGSADFFTGQISNVQIWDAAFSPEDVQYDFDNSHRGGLAYERDGSALTRANLKGFWPLIDGSGHIAHDHSDNANHGTLTNFPTDDSQWVHTLPSPLVPQTALMGWCLGSNLFEYSNLLEHPNWTKYYVSIVSNNAIGPDGNLSASTVTDTTDNQKHQFTQVLPTIPSGSAIETVVYAKAGTIDTFTMQKSDYTSVLFDLTNVTAGPDGTITSVGNGWYRCTMYATSVADITQIYILLKDDVYTGNGSSIYFWNFSINIKSVGASIITADAPAINAIAPLDPWQVAGRFPRDFGELNWNGRSYADAGNQADVNPSTAVVIELIVRNNTYGEEIDKEFVAKGSSFTIDASRTWSPDIGQFYIYPEEGDAKSVQIRYNGAELFHLVCVYDSRDQLHFVYVNSVSLGTNQTWPDGRIKQNNSILALANLHGSGRHLLGQLSLFVMHKDADAQEIIDGDLDQWVADLYQQRLDQGFLPLPIEYAGDPVTYNSQPVTYRR